MKKFRPNKIAPLHRQVMEFLEDQISQGTLTPGTRLPSTDGLATQLNVGRKVIQQALANLADKGLLERSPGRGTFVSRGALTHQIAILFPSHILSAPNAGFYRLVCGELLKQAKRMGLKATVHLPTDVTDDKDYLEEANKLAETGQYRGIINFSGAELKNLQIPWVRASSSTASTPIRETNAFRGLNYLLSRGYGNIVVIEHGHDKAAKGNPATQEAVNEALADYSHEATVSLHAANNIAPDAGLAAMDKALATIAGRPDAALVLDDNLASGVTFSIMQHGMRIPEDIAVISHANKGNPILCPVELTRLENDPAEFANQALEALLAKLQGKEKLATPHRAKLVVGKSCGE